MASRVSSLSVYHWGARLARSSLLAARFNLRRRVQADPVTVVITYQAQVGQDTVALRELTTLIATVVANEPACMGIRLHQDADDDTRFLLYERWTDRDAYTGPHMRTPHLQAFIEKAPAFLAGPPDITFWEVIEDVPQTERPR